MATSMTRIQHHVSEINTIYRRHTVAFKMLPASIELVRCDVYEPGIESPILEPSWAHLKVRSTRHLQCTVIAMLGRVKVHRRDRCPRLNGYKSFRNRGPIRWPRINC